MNREIKYRQPILQNGKFKEWHYWGFCGELEGEFVTPHSDYRNGPSFQFTGLKDKSGVDVYEGDKKALNL